MSVQVLLNIRISIDVCGTEKCKVTFSLKYIDSRVASNKYSHLPTVSCDNQRQITAKHNYFDSNIK